METVARLRQPAHHLSQARLLSTRPRRERANRALVERLVSHLHGRGWVHRRQLRTELDISDDALRALARYSNGEVIGSSSRGYCLTRQASVEDVGAVVGEWLSRSKQLRARVAEVLQVLHGRQRVSGADAETLSGVA